MAAAPDHVPLNGSGQRLYNCCSPETACLPASKMLQHAARTPFIAHHAAHVCFDLFCGRCSYEVPPLRFRLYSIHL